MNSNLIIDLTLPRKREIGEVANSTLPLEEVLDSVQALSWLAFRLLSSCTTLLPHMSKRINPSLSLRGIRTYAHSDTPNY